MSVMARHSELETGTGGQAARLEVDDGGGARFTADWVGCQTHLEAESVCALQSVRCACLYGVRGVVCVAHSKSRSGKNGGRAGWLA